MKQEIQYMYLSKELDIACIQHDKPYGDFKDLRIKTDKN